MRIRFLGWLVAVPLLALGACAAPEAVVPTPTSTATLTPTAIPAISPPLLQDPPGTPFVRPSPPSASDPIAAQRLPMPSGFPIPPGAEPALLAPDDPTMIGHWFVPTMGFNVYNFYVDALPRAGFAIEGLYPGDIGAIIRFHEASQILQVYLTGDLEQTDLILRTDVP
ncbi:MAG: hypothetical protein ABI534_05980 [Chloroflexota bacterium]